MISTCLAVCFSLVLMDKQNANRIFIMNEISERFQIKTDFLDNFITKGEKWLF